MFPFSSHTRSHFVKTYGLGVRPWIARASSGVQLFQSSSTHGRVLQESLGSSGCRVAGPYSHTSAADGPRDHSDRRDREVAGPESSSLQACRLAENHSTLVSKRLLYSGKWEGAAECGSSSAAFGFRFPASRANQRGQAIPIFPNQR